MRTFNALRFPTSLLRASAEDAAFAALQAFHSAQRELAMPIQTRPVTAVHADVLRSQRVAESLALVSA